MTPEEILKQILPENLVKSFDIILARERNEVLHDEFEEKMPFRKNSRIGLLTL